MLLTDVDLSVEVDLSLEPACEASFHETIRSNDSAFYLVKISCRGCNLGGTRLMGTLCYYVGCTTSHCLECPQCGMVGDGTDFWTVVRTL